MDSPQITRTATILSGALTRRAALRGLTGAAAVTLASHNITRATQTTDRALQIEPRAGSWKTWLLTSGDQFRPVAPPDESATAAELADMEAMISERSAVALDRVAYWDAGAPTYRWNQLTIQHLLANGIGGPRAARVLALVNVAMYDATIAAWDAKYAFQRLRPAQALPSLTTVVPTPASPAYPSEHAVTASAAATVLSGLFPDEASTFAALAEEAGQTRVLAGTDYPSDVVVGMDLGRRVAEVALAHAKTDGSDAVWAGSIPDEPGKWSGTKPAEPLAGTWQPWVLTSGDQFRPGPPPAHDSAQMARDLAELKAFERTTISSLTASFWEYYGGRASFEFWTNQTSRKLFEERLDSNPPRAARAYALQMVANYDLFVACWDAKYAYWAIRPFQLDPTVTTVFPTPNHPSYPAAHASLAGAMETVLGALFPRDAEAFSLIADEESWSRLWAGIHFRSDIEAGRTLGRAVGQSVIDWAALETTD